MKIWHHRPFWVIVVVLLLVVVGFRVYIRQMEKKGLNLQIGYSLYPTVTDYFSWSLERPMGPKEWTVVGEFYTYKRPAPDYSKMNFWQRLTVWLYETTSGGRKATKQCHWVANDGKSWDTGSDDKIIPTSDIVGRVVEIYDSKYRQLSKTPEGQFQLKIERHNLLTNHAWSPNKQFVVCWDDAGFSIFAVATQACMMKRSRQFAAFQYPSVFYWTSQGKSLLRQITLPDGTDRVCAPAEQWPFVIAAWDKDDPALAARDWKKMVAGRHVEIKRLGLPDPTQK